MVYHLEEGKFFLDVCRVNPELFESTIKSALLANDALEGSRDIEDINTLKKCMDAKTNEGLEYCFCKYQDSIYPTFVPEEPNENFEIFLRKFDHIMYVMKEYYRSRDKWQKKR